MTEYTHASQAPKRTDIISGPSREEIFDALRLPLEKRVLPFTLTLSSRESKIFGFLIDSIHLGGGSDGDSWGIGLQATTPEPRPHSFGGYYSTKTRKGFLTRKFF